VLANRNRTSGNAVYISPGCGADGAQLGQNCDILLTMDRQVKALMDAAVLAFPASQKHEVSFNRAELELILKLYGHKVIASEWRDYAIDHLKDRAVFSVFRRASEVPLYTIEKTPANSRKQGAYSVIAAGGHVLKRGHQLASVLKVLEK
jgi:hypothetical protein